MTDDHDWVARLLADAGPATMPDDVAARLDRALRTEADRMPAEPAPATDDVPPTHLLSPGPAPSPAAGNGAPAVPPPAVPPPAVPPPAVPPPASTTTGALPRLRSVTTTGPSTDRVDGTASAPGSRGPGSGSSRRDLHADDDGERRRRALVRWAPVAAGVMVLGGAAVAVGALFDGGEDATLADSAESADSAGAGAAMEEAGPPRSLVATGTQYSTADRAAFDAQVRELVALAAADPAAAAAEPEALSADEAAPSLEADAGAAAGSAPESAALSASPSQARAAAEDSPLADPQALAECVEAVTSGTSSSAAAVDLAVVDGLESTLLVVPDAAGMTYQVYVVGAGCSDLDTRFDFLTVTP